MLNTLSNMELEIDSLQNHIDIYWDEYEFAEVKHYIIIRKKYSIPTNIKDGSLIYDGLETDCSDTNVKNGELYYYRLFICLDDDIYTNNIISDSKCVAKAIGFTTETDYGELLYNTFPEQVRYDDKKLDKDYPLKRMMKLIAFPFNRLNTYVDAMLEQLDVDTCDEKYLPYLAKWNGLEYNENLTADLNRLIIKTWNEAEPYIGTDQGVKYFLQRIFKAEVTISLENGVSLELHIALNSNNIWLLEHMDYIKKMIRQYCALSINYTFTTSIVDVENMKKKPTDLLVDKISILADKDEIIPLQPTDSFVDKLAWVDEEFGNKPADILYMISGTNDFEYLTNYTFFTNDVKVKDLTDRLYDASKVIDENYNRKSQESSSVSVTISEQIENALTDKSDDASTKVEILRFAKTNDMSILFNDNLYTNDNSIDDIQNY